MGIQTNFPGAAGTASGDRIRDSRDVTLEYRVRKEWATAAAYALQNCDPEDAAQLCAGVLDAMATGGPQLGDPFGVAVSDARLWADCAAPHELVAYGTAALDRLQSLALGANTRKRLFARLWETFDPRDRQAFLSRVGPEGRLHRGAA